MAGDRPYVAASYPWEGGPYDVGGPYPGDLLWTVEASADPWVGAVCQRAGNVGHTRAFCGRRVAGQMAAAIAGHDGVGAGAGPSDEEAGEACGPACAAARADPGAGTDADPGAAEEYAPPTASHHAPHHCSSKTRIINQ